MQGYLPQMASTQERLDQNLTGLGWEFCEELQKVVTSLSPEPQTSFMQSVQVAFDKAWEKNSISLSSKADNNGDATMGLSAHSAQTTLQEERVGNSEPLDELPVKADGAGASPGGQGELLGLMVLCPPLKGCYRWLSLLLKG